MPRHRKLLLGLLLGAGLGLGAHALGGDSRALAFVIGNIAAPAGKIFVRLLLLLSVPVVFSALALGVADLDFRQLGRIGGRTLGYTVVVSVLAAGLGLVLVNVLQPGAGAAEQLRARAAANASLAPSPAARAPSVVEFLVAIVPTNPIQAAASGDLMGFIFFALLFGIGLARVEADSPASATLKQVLRGVFEVSMRLVDMVLGLAPFGVAALLFSTTAEVGAGVLGQLAAYVLVVLLGLGVHMFGVYSLSVWWLGGRSPRAFFRDSQLALVTAFSTASSSATLPTALRVADEKLRLPSEVSRFVLTAGSTMNQNGTALYEGVTVLFLAQVYGVEMGLGKQAAVMGVSVLAGIGTAGVPAGSLPIMATILTMLGIPAEGIAIILGVDRFLDMCRTTVNVAGDLAAAVFVARGQPGEPDRKPGS